MRGTCFSSVCSSTPLAVGSGAPSGPSFCAIAGAHTIIASSILAEARRRMRVRNLITTVLLSCRGNARGRRAEVDVLMIGRQPTPRAGTVAASQDPFLVDLGDDIAVTGEQRLGRAHLGAHRQLAFAKSVGSVFRIFRGAAGRFGPAAAGAIGAFVHLAARAEIADLRILRRAERTGVKAIAATNTNILVVQHDADFGRIDARHRTYRRARRVGAVHARHCNRSLAGVAVVDCVDPPPGDAPWHLVLVLAGGVAGVAV